MGWLSLFQLRHRSCGVADYIEHNFGMGEHGNMAGCNLRNLSAHALRGKAFQIGMDGAILGGHDGPTRLCPPSDASIVLLREQISGRREMGGPHDALLLGS